MREERRRYIYETLMSAKQALLGITGEESMTEFLKKLEENRTELTDHIQRAICIIQEPDKETDAEIIADCFGCPCDYSPIAEEMMEMNHDECAEVCGKRTDAECWQRYFDLKRKEDKL